MAFREQTRFQEAIFFRVQHARELARNQGIAIFRYPVYNYICDGSLRGPEIRKGDKRMATMDTGASSAPDGGQQAVAYRDSPEDVARIGRYEDYLKLQAKADGLTNEQYLAELERIMAPEDKFDEADTRYGNRDAAREHENTELRENLEGEEAENDGHGAGNGLLPNTGAAAEQLETEAVTDGQDPYRGSVEDPETVPEEDGPDPVPAAEIDGRAVTETETAEAGTAENEHEGVPGEGSPDANPENAADASYGSVDGLVPDAPDESVEAEDPVQEPAPVVSDGYAPPDGQSAAFSPDDVEEELPDPASEAGVAQAASAYEEPEGPSGGPGGAYQETVMTGGYVSVREEAYQVHDFLDEMSVATGLASSVQTAEYVPPAEITITVPDGQPAQPKPERGKIYQQMLDMNAAERVREPVPDRSGPEH